MLNIFKNLFSTDLYPPPKDLVDDYFKLIRFHSPAELPEQYDSLLKEAAHKGESMGLFLKELIQRRAEVKSDSEMLKLLTLIHVFAVGQNYSRDDIICLEDMEVMNENSMAGQKWFSEFCTVYLAYLVKLPSMSDIYQKMGEKSPEIAPSLHLTHLFRITNNISSLALTTLNAVNVVGRYQSGSYPQMKQLYQVISKQVVQVYNMIKFLSDHITRQYRIYSPNDIQCFLGSLPELELVCDKMEDLVVNKYLAGKRLSCKVEFKEDRVAELLYYLQYELKGKKEEACKETEMDSHMGLCLSQKNQN